MLPESSEARAGVSAVDGPSELHLTSSKPVELLPARSDLVDARRHLSDATEEALHGFAVRQLRARRRLTELLTFYRAHPCRLAHVHLLAAAAVTLGRFCGFSVAYDEMGDAFMPVTLGGSPRGNAWKAYANACDRGRPIETRDELWLEAHFADLAAVREAGLEAGLRPRPFPFHHAPCAPLGRPFVGSRIVRSQPKIRSRDDASYSDHGAVDLR